MVSVIVAALATPGYRIGSDTLSRLASPGAPYASPLRAAFIAYGLVVLINAAEVRRLRRWPTFALALLQVHGLGAIAAGIAQKNLPGTPATTLSELHVLAAFLAGASLISAMLTCAARDSIPRRALATATGAAAAMLAGIAFPLAWGTSVYGTLEITTLAIPAIWLAMTSGAQRSTDGPAAARRAASSGAARDEEVQPDELKACVRY